MSVMNNDVTLETYIIIIQQNELSKLSLFIIIEIFKPRVNLTIKRETFNINVFI